MRAIIVGAVESTRIAVRSVARADGWTLAAVVTLPPDRAARHSDFVDLTEDTAGAGAILIHAPDSNAAAIVEAVAELAADVVFVIGWSQICRAPFRAAAAGQVIGYHPAPLPRLRGRGVIPWTILLEESITAGTLFWIDDGVDSGDILAQHFLHVARDETAASLYARQLAVLETMLNGVLVALAAGTATRTAQDERFATWAARRVPDDGLIDWRQPAGSIDRLVRAVGRPYPGAFTSAQGERLTVWRGEVWSDGRRHAASPGQIIVNGDDDFVVCCGDGLGFRVTDWSVAHGQRPGQHARLGGA